MHINKLRWNWCFQPAGNEHWIRVTKCNPSGVLCDVGVVQRLWNKGHPANRSTNCEKKVARPHSRAPICFVNAGVSQQQVGHLDLPVANVLYLDDWHASSKTAP